MKSVNGKKKNKKRILRILFGLGLGSGAGYLASLIAGSAGSQCLILCNQAVAIPYFAVIGFLVAWR